ncbi:cytochrome c, partial [Klebsiella pneumoniae]|nr:cytochrome c [Klebsiella pneumoniae]
FAGGLPMETHIGTVYSTNITPDATGIGQSSVEHFDLAVRKGVAKDGSTLYPAMPYPSYARVKDEDMRALYAYFMQG